MNCALIVAAGKGTRMGIEGGKQFLPLMGKPVLAHTLIAFQKASSIDQLVIVATTESIERCRELVSEFGITKASAIVEGGKERTDSVFNGIKAIVKLDGIVNVVVHDGARPLIEPRLIDETTANLVDCDGVIVGIPAVDTIKLVRDGFVVKTVSREEVWQIQTPQAFGIDAIIKAHEQAKLTGFCGTDDSVLVERYGGRIKVVAGSRDNLKITTPEDLLFAEAVLSARSE